MDGPLCLDLPPLHFTGLTEADVETKDTSGNSSETTSHDRMELTIGHFLHKRLDDELEQQDGERVLCVSSRMECHFLE